MRHRDSALHSGIPVQRLLALAAYAVGGGGLASGGGMTSRPRAALVDADVPLVVHKTLGHAQHLPHHVQAGWHAILRWQQHLADDAAAHAEMVVRQCTM